MWRCALVPRPSSSIGLKQVSVGLDGAWTIGALASKLNLTWPLPDGLMTIANPSVVYTVVPAALLVGMQVSIPSLNITNMTSSLTIQAGGSFTLDVSGKAGGGHACWVMPAGWEGLAYLLAGPQQKAAVRAGSQSRLPRAWNFYNRCTVYN